MSMKVCVDAFLQHIFYIRCVCVCVCVQCYHCDLKWRSFSNFRQFAGTCSATLPFDPLSVCLGRAQEFASASRARCQPAWHHQIYFYSLQIEPLLYPYWHIPRLRGAWLHSRTSTRAKCVSWLPAETKPAVNNRLISCWWQRCSFPVIWKKKKSQGRDKNKHHRQRLKMCSLFI